MIVWRDWFWRQLSPVEAMEEEGWVRAVVLSSRSLATLSGSSSKRLVPPEVWGVSKAEPPEVTSGAVTGLLTGLFSSKGAGLALTAPKASSEPLL